MNKEKLSECEEMIMSVIWKADEDPDVQQVSEQLKAKFGKEWKVQTILTFISRMRTKGYISIYKKGRYSHYHPEVDLQEYRAWKMEEVRRILLFDSQEKMAEFVENM